MLQLLAPPLPRLLEAGEDTYEFGQSHPNRKGIGVFDLLVVTKGELAIGENGNEYQVLQGSSLVLNPDGHHYSLSPCDKMTHFYWFHFTTENRWSEIIDSSSSTPLNGNIKKEDKSYEGDIFGIRLPKFCKINNVHSVEELCRRINRLENESVFSREWKRQTIFQELLQELAGNTALSISLPSAALAEKAAVYLRRNFTKRVTYKELGEALRFHPNHIARCMINTLGCTPIEYINRIRMDQAKIYLISKQWSIEEISEKCGFTQVSYFSRLFKKQEGLTPNAYRKQYFI